MQPTGRWLVSAGLILASGVLGGCSKDLTERNVRQFIDDADHAFLAGHAADICSMRSDDFKFTGSTFKLAEGHTVSDLNEAVRLESEREESGERASAGVVTLNARDYCRMAIESRAMYRRVSLVRTSLEITISPDHKQAIARAHYVTKSPEYAHRDSSLSAQDYVENQIGTIQTESDDESVIIRNSRGKLVFSSTHAVSKEFHVQKERDSRL
jgi:hypothetical protein